MLALTNHTLPPQAEAELKRQGHRVLRLPPHPTLPAPVASHPDMLLFFAEDRIFCTKSYHQIASRELEEISRTCGLPIHLIDSEYGKEYPHDVPLNAFPLGKHLFCNIKTVAPELLDLGLFPHHVNQGYTKCSTLPLGDDALISADPSIVTAAREKGIEVLQIEAGHVALEGYDYGFIGGCASCAPMGGLHTIYFCGDLAQHPAYKSIKTFCEKHHFEVCSLGDFPLLDVGTIFMI